MIAETDGLSSWIKEVRSPTETNDVTEIRTIDKSCAIAERPHNDFLDSILGWAFPVLDHGFVRVVNYLGNEDAIVQAARVSYGKGTKTLSDDVGLIRYLVRHRHTSPMEFPVITLHLKMPIFTARQWLRHRTASVNEYSARYSILDREFYIPNRDRVAFQSTTNKQGSGNEVPPELAMRVIEMLRDDSAKCHDDYEVMATDAGSPIVDRDGEVGLGIARELARIGLGVNTYTQFYWQINAHNLMHFLGLRADSHAQQEIADYADVICDNFLKGWMPNLYQAFCDYRRNSFTLSAGMISIIQNVLGGALSQVTYEDVEQLGVTRREFRELSQVFTKK